MENRQNDFKAKRYDRQIRIWGAQGQERLETARVCLLKCSATGSELLKNLVLGGIHSFTIVDDAKVTSSDLGNNFMVSSESVGHSRADCVAELLKEMNETVVGTFVEEAPETLIETKPTFFRSFDLVVATQMREADLLKLDGLCRQAGVKLLIARSYGLVGLLRISTPEHRVTDSKPDNVIWDLRLSCPFPALEEWALSYDLASLDDVMHKHMPYVVILLQAARAWKSAHDGELPKTSSERAEFKDSIRKMQRTVEGVPVAEDNFSEALANAHRVWIPMGIPYEVRQIMDDPAADITRESDDFWIMVAALRAFVASEGKGLLPLDGLVPDMTATTELYLEMQRVYQAQAAADVAAVMRHVEELLVSIGREKGIIPEESVRSFCKLARHMRVMRYKPLAEEVACRSSDDATIKTLLENEDVQADVSLYLLLRAADRFYKENHRFPGSFDEEIDEDIAQLKGALLSVVSETYPGVSPQVSDDLVSEIVRFGASELHSVASVVGGIGAQESIKIITGQFVPAEGNVVYNAMACTTSVFAL